MVYRILGYVFVLCGFCAGGIGVAWLIAINPAQAGGNGPPALPGGVLIAAGILVIVLGGLLIRHGRHVQAIAKAARGAPGRFVDDTRRVVKVAGHTYTLVYRKPVTGKNGRPSLLRFSVPAETKAQFKVKAENGFDRWCKRLGIAKEIQTGDAAFDDACYVRSDDVEFCRQYFDDAVSRQSILDLQNLGFKEIVLEGRQLQANWSGFEPSKHDRPDLDATAAARLLALADNLPSVKAGPDVRVTRRRRKCTIWLFVGEVGFAATLFFFHYSPLYVGQLFVASLAVSFPAYLLFAWLAARLLRGTSTSHDNWLGLIVVAIFMIPLGGVAITSLLNAQLDRTPVTMHFEKISGKATHHSNKSTHYVLQYRSWVKPGEQLEYSVNHDDYERASIGVDEMHVATSAGALGVEWIHSALLVKPLAAQPPLAEKPLEDGERPAR